MEVRKDIIPLEEQVLFKIDTQVLTAVYGMGKVFLNDTFITC